MTFAIRSSLSTLLLVACGGGGGASDPSGGTGAHEEGSATGGSVEGGEGAITDGEGDDTTGAVGQTPGEDTTDHPDDDMPMGQGEAAVTARSDVRMGIESGPGTGAQLVQEVGSHLCA